MRRLIATLAIAVVLVIPGTALAGSGGPGADRLYGTNTADVLSGGAGNDVIFGKGGDDVIRGGSGFDSIWGGAGFDTCYVDAHDAVSGCEVTL